VCDGFKSTSRLLCPSSWSSSRGWLWWSVVVRCPAQPAAAPS